MGKISVDGLNVVVTGKVAGESRESAEEKLRAAGAHTHKSVTATTHLLVMGDAVGQTKVKAAQAKGARAVRWEEVALDGGGESVFDAAAEAPAAGPPLAARPAQIAPMLCGDGETLPSGGDWLFEVKWDGVRAIATIAGGAVSIQSRSGKTEYAPQYPKITAALAELDDCVLDGEIVVLDAAGASSFQQLAGGRNGGTARYIVYDVLSCPPQGAEAMRWPLRARKELLHGLLENADGTYIAESPVFDDGAKLLEEARKRGLEGIVAKRGSSTYQEGTRGPHWLKFKLRCSQEFVVVGWTPGKGKLTGTIGSLVLAVNNESVSPPHVTYALAGHCGCGDDAEHARMQAKLEQIERELPPDQLLLSAKERKEAARDAVRWVEPQVIVQVEFQRWTPDDRLWHPSYQGERLDKSPADVKREPCAA